MTFPTCVQHKEDILKNVGNQTTLEPFDFHFMEKKTLGHLSEYILCSKEDKVMQVWNDVRVNK